MPSLVDETIRLAGRQATILRSPANISTYVIDEITGVDSGKKQLDPYLDFETAVRFLSDSTVVCGDMVQIGSDYFLVMAVEVERAFNSIEFYRTRIYKCNSTVSVYYFSAITKLFTTLHLSGVRCLITQVRAREWNDDKSLIIKGYGGRIQPFQVFAQDDSGITKESALVDQAGRRFRVSKEFDVFIADGILQSQVIWES